MDAYSNQFSFLCEKCWYTFLDANRTHFAFNATELRRCLLEAQMNPQFVPPENEDDIPKRVIVKPERKEVKKLKPSPKVTHNLVVSTPKPEPVDFRYHNVKGEIVQAKFEGDGHGVHIDSWTGQFDITITHDRHEKTYHFITIAKSPQKYQIYSPFSMFFQAQRGSTPKIVPIENLMELILNLPMGMLDFKCHGHQITLEDSSENASIILKECFDILKLLDQYHKLDLEAFGETYDQEEEDEENEAISLNSLQILREFLSKNHIRILNEPKLDFTKK